MSAVDELLSLLHKVTVKERDDLADALRLAASNYGPCDQCDAPAAELWHWNPGYSRPHGDEVEELTCYCKTCATSAGVLEECSPAEPQDEIAAIVKVRHLFWRRATR